MSNHKLNTYLWYGIDSSGRKINGKTLAACQAQIMEQLNERNIQVRLVKKRPLTVYKQIRERANAKEITRLTRQWASMTASGLPIATSLKLIANNSQRAGVKSLIWLLRQKLEAGLSVTQALQQSSEAFDSIFLAIVNAGENTGRLAEALERAANYREKAEYLRSKVIGAAIYPSLVLATTILVTILMLTQVIPELERMFTSYNSPLPWFTQQVIKLSRLTLDYGIYTGAVAIFITFTIQFGYCHSNRFRHSLDRLKLKIPLFGKLYSQAGFTLFSRTLATCFESGVSITPCLHTSARIFKNTYYQQKVHKLTQEVNSGLALNFAMRHSGIFPEFMLQMVMLGEESGRLADMLNRVADEYETEIEKTIEHMSQAFEPIMIVILGSVVASLVIAMYLPIFNLVSVMS
ncbi:type II secretion system F family protein [Vibrio hepatarius]|uniref:type II secretion system F family protein n=1 Tax=Vibrio hepatarius TaxID=171383 RepID=UPI001C085AC3|nr:type II secretion system F family protein [Vibrio hepatarius]MBU2896386.1 type II secretion system F family protein [Vibrio hepatarius]